MYDLLINNVSVIDGTGTPAFQADVAVKEGKIVLDPDMTEAKEVIDGEGLCLCPGFIDAHSHGDIVLGQESARLCKTSQGITTEICGQCGDSLFPVSEDRERRDMLARLVGSFTETVPEELSGFTTMERYLQYVKSVPKTCNLKMYVGHAALRIAAMGFDNRVPSEAEMEHMKTMLREAMDQGALGMSSGLLYSPSGYATEDELVELCKVVAEYDGFYASHIRNEAANVVTAVREAISVAEKAGCRLCLSHHKVCGKDNWGLSVQTLQLVHEAIDRGVRITLDVYPYTASMSNLNVCLPADFFSHGPEKMRELLKLPEVRAELKEQIKVIDGRYRHCGGFHKILVALAPNTPECRGLTVEEYASKVGKDPFDTYFDILVENGHSALAIYFSMDEEELQRIMADENAVVGSDGIVLNLTEPTHPRGFGTFPKAIRYFVREKKQFTLEEMIHKMTQLTAERFLISNKGVIDDGYDADLVLFRKDEIRDCATYQDSCALCEGIERVIVAGTTVYREKALTGETPGQFVAHVGKAEK
ncbi:MAG: D-aminoacylase [Firmicutes bacterium]|nr:D-aminoacylase [Bacillota bacterium]